MRNLKLYVICDFYLGVYHDIALDPIDVAEGEVTDSDEDMDSDEYFRSRRHALFVS